MRLPPADLARRFLGEMEREHTDLMRRVRRLREANDATKQSTALMALCTEIKLHFAAELAVFHRQVATATGSELYIVSGRQEFRAALKHMQTIQSALRFKYPLDRRLSHLQVLLWRHIGRCEGPRGIHYRAASLPLDWAAIESAYRLRRQDTQGV